jgi:hypothetical protein
MSKHAQAIINTLERQGMAVDFVGANPQIGENLATVRLRFDRVALRFVDDVRAALYAAVPDGKTLVFTIAAPIRLASKTAAALEAKVRGALARANARIDLTETIHGNEICVRLLRGANGARAIGFVHNPDGDPDVLFDMTQAYLEQIDAAARSGAPKARGAPKPYRASGHRDQGGETGMKKNGSQTGKSPSRLIDTRIKELDDWRGEMLGRLRALVKEADPEVVEEWKWRGVPVWSDGGIICTGETYKSVVKMTFAKGAALKDPSRLFNSSLEGNVRRAIDFREGEKINEKALKDLIRAAVVLNKSKGKK